MQDVEHSAVTDLSLEGYDPYEVLLTLQSQMEELQQQNNRIIEHLNTQAGIVHAQARVLENLFQRLQQLEEERK